MPLTDVDNEELIRTLTDNFNILADQFQVLSDRNLILTSKLSYGQQEYQRLADKYAPGDAEVSSTLAKLQLLPDLQISTPDRAGFVPLPQRKQTSTNVQTAVAIRDGRRAAQRLAQLTRRSTGSTVSGRSISGTSSLRFSARKTSLSTVLEQDFTVQGKKSSLLCPYARTHDNNKPHMENQASQGSVTLNSDGPLTPADLQDRTPHQSSDPICAAMYAETMASPPPSATGSAAKCPIRYLDQHSPEEVARYFETHKHEIPRSHEVCVKRYQRNEEDIRKLDAKYGNLVSMIQGLGQKHQPMLPSNEEDEALEVERGSNERVENWANAVSADGVGVEDEPLVQNEEDRESRFDRPLKEIRVGESPSRPWGISVPILEPPDGQRPVSPPPAPISDEHIPKPAGKCPFGHEQQKEVQEEQEQPQERPAGKCPFPHAEKTREVPREQPNTTYQPASTMYHDQPAFIQPPEIPKGNGIPQMIFTGPVFIGYPMDQAMAFMQQFRGTQ
ncbi:uncharacterized protein LY89DRAFT_575450 [Mollisia scopiformis]|uniref:Uncharacterized protein n=1 Tax=Mollisia scopiformis TaxID=149040 RepID=A0A194XR15_MOLSC|nr:uncharacterized protein LY89DRAFT_575450 [Mollisia scopiformis]KUJ22730.1 hypothetical protein LY89DRAFT_575450 [Mollisia scopiformis]